MSDLVKLTRECVQALGNEMVAHGKGTPQQVSLYKLSMATVADLGSEVEALRRQQEILAFISFEVGFRWQALGENAAQAVMDALEGSVGLNQKSVEWAKEYDAIWEALPEGDPRRQDFISEVGDFAGGKFDALVAQIRLDT